MRLDTLGGLSICIGEPQNPTVKHDDGAWVGGWCEVFSSFISEETKMQRRAMVSPGLHSNMATGSELEFRWCALERKNSCLGAQFTQMVKNLPAMWESWVRPLGWEDSLEKGMAAHFQYSCLENPMDIEAC